MSLAGLSAGLDPTSFFSSLRMRAVFEEEPAFFSLLRGNLSRFGHTLLIDRWGEYLHAAASTSQYLSRMNSAIPA